MTFASIKFDLSCLRHGHFPSLPELSAVLSVMAPGPPDTPARKNLHATSWLDCGSSKGNAGISMPCSICLLHLLELTIQEANHRISCVLVGILGDEITRNIPTWCRPYIGFSYRGLILGIGVHPCLSGQTPCTPLGEVPTGRRVKLATRYIVTSAVL